MKQATQKKKETPEGVTLTYDADVRNRCRAYTVPFEGKEYKTAHTFDPLTDERYLQWLREFNVKQNNDEVTEETREASIRLWDDLIYEVDEIEVEGDADWKDLIPFKEKIVAINDLLAVAVFDPEEVAEGKRRLTATQTQTVLTEAWFQNTAVQQTHVLQVATLEWQKKYSRIQSKRVKQEATRGLRRKPKLEFRFQDAKIGELYDEMVESTTGFAGRIPLRFKTAVIEHIFDTSLEAEEKK